MTIKEAISLARIYKMMVELRENAKPMTQEEFDKKLEEHYKFMNSGGAGGRWETLVTEGGIETGVVFGVYVGPKGTEGEQLNVSHSNLEQLNLENIFLAYADLVGILCRNQNFKKTDLTGSLFIDSDFTGTSFEGADLSKADFSRSKMINCNFSKANLTNTDMEDVDLTGSDLRSAILDDTRFRKSILKDCHLNLYFLSFDSCRGLQQDLHK
jgi:hypothetical protein